MRPDSFLGIEDIYSVGKLEVSFAVPGILKIRSKYGHFAAFRVDTLFIN
jgi:hypothetical protein